MTSISSYKGEHLSYAYYSISANSNEDRFSASINHSSIGVKSLATFGVFDGHMGAACADACSTQLHSMVAKNYRNLINAASKKKLVESQGRANDGLDTPDTESPWTPPVQQSDDPDIIADSINSSMHDLHVDGSIKSSMHDIPQEEMKDTMNGNNTSYLNLLNTGDLRDAIMCESIRRAHEEMDNEVKKHTNSGSTAVSLYLQWEGEDQLKSGGMAGLQSRPVRVFCANAGDSRCVMLRSYDTVTALTLPSYYKKQMTKSISERDIDRSILHAFSTQSSIEDYDLRSSISIPVTHRSNSDGTPQKINKLVPLNLTKPIGPIAKRFTAVHLMSEDHKLSLSRERMRITKKTEAQWHTLPADASAIYLPQYARTGPPIVGMDQSPSSRVTKSCPRNIVAGSIGSNTTTALSSPFSTSPPNSTFFSAPAIPDRTGLSSFTRRSFGGMAGMGGSTPNGLSSTTHGAKHSMQAGTKSITRTSLHGIVESRSAHDLECSTGPSGFIFDWAYPSEEDEDAAEEFISQACEDISTVLVPHGTFDLKVSGDDAESLGLKNPNAAHDDEKKVKTMLDFMKDGSYEPPQIYRKSFIQSRHSRDGIAVGPEALFGRHNISILMTRSLGDRFGPRSCISLPEISSYTVPVDTHVRFVLASDGFWDVVSVEAVRCLGLTDLVKDPKSLASLLAQKAYRRRERAKMRMDDISVMVVDVNPRDYIAVNGKNGGDGAVGNGEKCSIS